MRAITVQQPWAWAITHADKNIENRTNYGTWRAAQGTTIAIHAGMRWSHRGEARIPWHPDQQRFTGAIIGTTYVDEVHYADTDCDPRPMRRLGGERLPRTLRPRPHQHRPPRPGTTPPAQRTDPLPRRPRPLASAGLRAAGTKTGRPRMTASTLVRTPADHTAPYGPCQICGEPAFHHDQHGWVHPCCDYWATQGHSRCIACAAARGIEHRNRSRKEHHR